MYVARHGACKPIFWLQKRDRGTCTISAGPDGDLVFVFHHSDQMATRAMDVAHDDRG